MGAVGHRLILPLLTQILVPPVFSVLAPNPIQAGETPTVLPATVTPTERLAPPLIWLDTLQFRLTAHFTKKYPAYDCSPYARKLDQIRMARSGRWGCFSQCCRVVPNVAVGIQTKKEGLIMASHNPVTNRILGEVTRTHGCDLDTLTKRLPDLSWGQVFNEVDRLSRQGMVLVTFGADHRYMIRLPEQDKGSANRHV